MEQIADHIGGNGFFGFARGNGFAGEHAGQVSNAGGAISVIHGYLRTQKIPHTAGE
ncbi:hypothetical protein LJR221_001453 [Agrobacterium tumefaciens]